VSRYRKGKTNLDFTEARDNEWQWHQLGHMQVCISLQTDNHASTTPLSFLQTGCPSCRQTNSVKALKAKHKAQNECEIGARSYTVAVARHEIAEADTDESDGAVVGGFPVRPLFDLHEDRARHEHEQARARHRNYHDPVHTSTYVYFSKPE